MVSGSVAVGYVRVPSVTHLTDSVPRGVAVSRPSFEEAVFRREPVWRSRVEEESGGVAVRRRRLIIACPQVGIRLQEVAESDTGGVGKL